MTTEQLNKAAKFLEEATGERPTKNEVFTLCIQTLVRAGMPTKEAFDTVLGKGRYDRFVKDVYAKLTEAA